MSEPRRAVSRDRSPRVSLADVARRAGVSTATVSRVINNVGQVRADTRQKVESVARALDYAPNSFARALASQRSHTIGVIVPSLRGSIFASGVEAMQRHAQSCGYSVLLACCDYDLDRELALARGLVARGVDGLILVGFLHHDDLAPMLQRRGIPFVIQGSWRRRTPHPCVGFDNVAAMEIGARHLLDLGHRRIAVIAGISAGNDRVQDRLIGIRTALAGAGVSLSPDRVIESPYELGAARAAMRQLLGSGERPTAVICINDVLAHGALLECQAACLDIPGQVSVIGFDDLDFAEHVHPALTTIRVPTGEMGAKAVDELLARVDGRQAPRRLAPMKLQLVVRGSTAPAPTG